MTIEEFSIYLFGRKSKCMNHEYLLGFFKEWEKTGYSIKQYKSLLVTRG